MNALKTIKKWLEELGEDFWEVCTYFYIRNANGERIAVFVYNGVEYLVVKGNGVHSVGETPLFTDNETNLVIIHG